VGGRGNAAPELCADSAALSERGASFYRGDIAAMRAVTPPRPLPTFAFASAEGPKTLADFKGRIVLFNLWATWCVPCREEMPALDRLEAERGSQNFTVLALNMDTRNTERVPQWLDDNNIKKLARYTDAEGKAFQALRKDGLVTGLPTTLLIGRDGCLIGAMSGPAKWDGADALALIAGLER
jgi:thiol-disulfide isomerase/thioredoxin